MHIRVSCHRAAITCQNADSAPGAYDNGGHGHGQTKAGSAADDVGSDDGLATWVLNSPWC